METIQINKMSNLKKLGLLSLLSTLTICIICYRTKEGQQNFGFNGAQKEDVADRIFSSESHLSQDDPLIVDFVKLKHVFPPTKKLRKLTKPVEKLSSKGVPELISILDLKKPGFFIECGANDGEFFSNTIDLEVNYNWTGLLVEGSPALFKKLQVTNRNAWMADVCLSGPHPERIEFLKHKDKFPNWRVGNGKINPGGKYKKPADILGGKEKFRRSDYISEGSVDCFPLYSILSAINVTHVDLFSLDVEGHEYKILEAIPYDLVHIEVIFVEHWLAPEGKQAIQKLMETNGYKVVKETESDFVFKKKHT